jgi:hypothetical protein
MDKLFMKITLERYFYPVGHGLCCRESFISDNGKEFNLVYDCGSLFSYRERYPRKFISRRIEQYFKDVKIDVLYISHFHKDHINLLSYIEKSKGCSIKNIVLPYLTKEDLLLTVIDKQVAADKRTKQLLLKATGDAEDSGETKYYLIPSFFSDKEEGDKEKIDVIEDNENIIHNGKNILEIIPGSSSFHSKILEFWNFLPYNNTKEQGGSVYNILINELKTHNINPDNVKDIVNNMDKIREIYDSLWKSDKIKKITLNEQSTLLMSLPEVTSMKSCHVQNKKYISEEKILGCLYFGDYPAKETPLPEKIEELIAAFLPCFGTIQIPHHGARNGELPKYCYYDKKCVVSCKLDDKNHPNKEIVYRIISNGGILVEVKEDTGYFQEWEFEVY